MAKAYFNAKLVKVRIAELRAAGKSDQEIYAELSEIYYDKKAVATTITGTPLEEDKRRYRIAWATLLTLLMLGAVSKVLMVILISVAERQTLALIMVLFVPIINLVFFFGIRNYTASMYRSCGLLVLAFALQGINSKNAEPVDVAVNICFAIVIAGLAFYLDGKLFPKYKPQNMSKDANGDYVV